MADEQARYPKLGKILNLLVKMQSRSLGITLKDIQEELEVSRRSAERLRDVLLWEVPQIMELETAGREKHWGFSQSNHLREIVNFTKDEIAQLENLKKNIDFEAQKEALDSVITKVKALSKRESVKIEDAIELLLKTEGYAVTQRPTYKIDVELLDKIRQAIKEQKCFTAVYDGREKIFSPYGIVYGSTAFLIAVEGDKSNPYVYRLHKLSEVKLTDKLFDKGDFDIKEYVNRSFGVYQNEIIKVELLFSKDVAEDVLNFNFHPTQKIKENEDGTVTVKFKASGEYEIMWHLFKWGADVKIISPKYLRTQYIEYLEKVLNKQK